MRIFLLSYYGFYPLIFLTSTAFVDTNAKIRYTSFEIYRILAKLSFRDQLSRVGLFSRVAELPRDMRSTRKSRTFSSTNWNLFNTLYRVQFDISSCADRL